MPMDSIEDVRTGDAIVRVSTSLSADFAERLVAFEIDRRATLPGARILAAPQVARPELDGWIDVPQTLGKMRDIKARFDPRNTFAPGRYVGGI
jgi:FAD/FMN-containing dehydrogenase